MLKVFPKITKNKHHVLLNEVGNKLKNKDQNFTVTLIDFLKFCLDATMSVQKNI